MISGVDRISSIISRVGHLLTRLCFGHLGSEGLVRRVAEKFSGNLSRADWEEAVRDNSLGKLQQPALIIYLMNRKQLSQSVPCLVGASHGSHVTSCNAPAWCNAISDWNVETLSCNEVIMITSPECCHMGLTTKQSGLTDHPLTKLKLNVMMEWWVCYLYSSAPQSWKRQMSGATRSNDPTGKKVFFLLLDAKARAQSVSR